MLDFTLNKIILLIGNILLDGCLLTLLFQVHNLEDITSVVKLVTSVLISIITLVRLYYFIKDRKNGEKDSKNTK